jgi:hypothetical protein
MNCISFSPSLRDFYPNIIHSSEPNKRSFIALALATTSHADTLIQTNLHHCYMQPHGFKNWSFGWHWRKSSAVNTENILNFLVPVNSLKSQSFIFCKIKSDIDHAQKNRHGDFIESDIDHEEWQSTHLLSRHSSFFFFLRNWPIFMGSFIFSTSKCDLRIHYNPLPLCTAKTEFVRIFIFFY